MLTPIQLKKLIDASFTKEGVYYSSKNSTTWSLFDPTITTGIQIGDQRYEWVEGKDVPKPQDKGQRIGTIGNSYGCLYLVQIANEEWQWGISDYDDHIQFKTIPNYLAEALLRYERERDK